jgi:protein involved in sex pheromone biosynthesis
MNEILMFFKEIFLCDENSCEKIGLSQFKTENIKQPIKKIVKVKKEVKLSDLMRKSA